MFGSPSSKTMAMMFMGAETHKAAGDYEIVETKGKQQIKFTDDFSVDQAPELHVVLSAGDSPDPNALDLGKLKKSQGGQSYDLPKGKDLSKYRKLLNLVQEVEPAGGKRRVARFRRRNGAHVRSGAVGAPRSAPSRRRLQTRKNPSAERSDCRRGRVALKNRCEIRFRGRAPQIQLRWRLRSESSA